MPIETSRLNLLTPEEVSAEAVQRYFVANRAFLADWEPRRSDDYYDLPTISKMVEAQQEQFRARTGVNFYLTRQGSAEVIGTIGFSNIVYGCFLSCFLGYRSSQGNEGQGLMQEGLRAAIRWVFESLQLHRIEANVMPRNLASKRVLERLGFELEGSSRKYLKINGVWEDHQHYVLLNEGVE
ncbi:GNAT family N-acetyltransferase [Rubrivivax benzoatilyticus]|uniref:GNAT family N-acetyltransferase n=1 Tax=Rubrivivax benzoatilyticus TaxID=316997 RepID=A0ABX0HXS0_9BURK|nr:GNAT family N-acetyltransferase [Rubrivivax benzoatilyticus]EGJ11271.1 ribosomal-protein-S5-alanine N-acetyltransferase [Rubrivivax benzoatilyticus JA2 = ATCC BAA-35]NHK99785.1 GNAT family N-acetyltransferase [Rubrivivax benzoatilyticus]NHL25658.1 GNAT family N-acetyltransferase [Rubrivivax benzoatilyticus]